MKEEEEEIIEEAAEEAEEADEVAEDLLEEAEEKVEETATLAGSHPFIYLHNSFYYLSILRKSISCKCHIIFFFKSSCYQDLLYDYSYTVHMLVLYTLL